MARAARPSAPRHDRASRRLPASSCYHAGRRAEAHLDGCAGGLVRSPAAHRIRRAGKEHNRAIGAPSKFHAPLLLDRIGEGGLLRLAVGERPGVGRGADPAVWARAGARIGAWAGRSRSLVLPVTLKLQLPGWDHPSGLWPVSGRQSHLHAGDGQDRSAIGRRCCPCSAAHDGCVARPAGLFLSGLRDDVGLGAGGILPVGCCSFTCGGARWSNAERG